MKGFWGLIYQGLISSGGKIFGLDIKIRRRDTILTPDDYKRISVIKGSVANYKLVEKIISKNKINVVFHLAAEAIVGKVAIQSLKRFLQISGDMEYFGGLQECKKIEAIIVASSDKAYGAHKKLPYTEEAALQGNHPYDVSKSCADLIANTYAHTYGLPVALRVAVIFLAPEILILAVLSLTRCVVCLKAKLYRYAAMVNLSVIMFMLMIL